MGVYSVNNVPTPFFAEIIDGFPHGGEVEVEGDIQGTDQAIWLELKAFDGIAVHFNVRMGRNGQHKIVINSYRNGKWEHEESHESQISHGGPITMSICNGYLRYELKVNGKSFHFPHRITGKHIARVEVTGDIAIRRFTFKNLDGHFKCYQTGGAPQQQYGVGPSQNPIPQYPVPEMGYGGPPQPYPPQPAYNPYPQQPQSDGGFGGGIQPMYGQPYPNQPEPSRDPRGY